ncbi:Putative Nucleosome assembly protein 1-like 1 [Rhizopus microsporus]|nr:Putative Nucleosome assembly protein 1-like 1 [Rhizopus microsporus]
MDSQQSGVDIKNKAGSSTAPTPQNTPINPAPITSTYRPSMNAISEDMETITTKASGNSALTGAFTGNPALLSMLQGKLGTLVGRSSGYIESLPAPVKRRLNGLKYFQSKHAELENKFQEEVLALEKKYLELYKPLYEQRAKIINGSYEPTEEEVALENEFFTNKVLVKTYYYQDQAIGGDFVYDHAKGCDIDWKEGKNLTVTVETKKQRHKSTNKSRVVKRTVAADSFFHFFSPPAIPTEDEEIDEEEAEGLDAKLEADYEMGEEFKDKIIPHAVDYFTGKALQYEDYDEDFDDEYYDEDDDEEENDDDDDDDDDDDAPAKDEKAPECKQS